MVSKKARNLAIKLVASDEFGELINEMQTDVKERWTVTAGFGVREDLYVRYQAISDLMGTMGAIARGDDE